MYGCTGRSQCTLLTWFTPYTMFSTGCGSFTGADTTTFLQPCTGAWPTRMRAAQQAVALHPTAPSWRAASSEHVTICPVFTGCSATCTELPPCRRRAAAWPGSGTCRSTRAPHPPPGPPSPPAQLRQAGAECRSCLHTYRPPLRVWAHATPRAVQRRLQLPLEAGSAHCGFLPTRPEVPGAAGTPTHICRGGGLRVGQHRLAAILASDDNLAVHCLHLVLPRACPGSRGGRRRQLPRWTVQHRHAGRSQLSRPAPALGLGCSPWMESNLSR